MSGRQHDALGHGILTWRAVNHCVVVPIGNDANILVDRRLGVPNDRKKRLALAGCAPIQSGGLRVAINQDYAVATDDQLAGDICRKSRLSDTAFLVKESNGYHRNTERQKSALL
jgi:hypothetical protein